MKILHIAAFEGNIGDNASHLGFLSILDSILDKYTIDRLEIRKAYRNYLGDDKLFFDESFTKLANDYDLIVFGGGGFLDYWVEGSSNGTTIDIENEILKKITTKVLITSVGCNPHRTVPIENYNKFRSFLDYVKKSTNVTIAVRNDGSVNSIKKDFGPDYLDGIVEILDHGYFYKPKNSTTLPINDKYVAINITDDQLNMEGGIKGEKDWYYIELTKLIETVQHCGYKAVFVPHIHQDIEAIGTALKYLPTSLVRESTIVAPCLQGDDGTDFIFNIYSKASFVVASRYHANVCALKFGVRTIGLSPLSRIQYTHDSLSLCDSSFFIQPGFSTSLKIAIEKLSLLEGNTNIYALDKMKLKTIEFYKEYFKKIKLSKV
ncbi:polysaccharide pyruvyl transferase family protein [Vibrio splendidus]|uniref:polysaccharide pyruvyl transferase family protein n=1 Tax=Vibrio splendidus TaxID=29497 RepID=UPI003D0D2EE1